jgi:hypothetical protein
MPDFKIFTEGKADVKFLKDYIKATFNEGLIDNDFDTLGGKTGYKAGGELKASIQQNHQNEKLTIIIVDAELDFLKSKNEIFTDFENYKISINLFQFPNNSANENLEDLLTRIAVDKKLMDCFPDYEKCVNAHPKKRNDSRVYLYLDMLMIDNRKDEKGKIYVKKNSETS